MNTWIYVFNEFRLVDINANRLFKLAEKYPSELFDAIWDVLEEYIKDIKDVRVCDIYPIYKGV